MRDLSTLFLVFIFATMLSVCGVKVMCVSNVRPRTFGVLFRGSARPKRVTRGWRLDSRKSGVSSVMEDFSAEADRRLVVNHSSRRDMYC